MDSLPILDCRRTTCDDEVARVAERGRNFILLLRDKHQDLPRICRLLKAGADCQPQELQKWTVYSLRPVLEEHVVQDLLDGLKKGTPALFVEKMLLHRNTPPMNGCHFLLYCEVLGQISQHETEAEAREALRSFFNTHRFARSFPEAGVYMWTGSSWVKRPHFPA